MKCCTTELVDLPEHSLTNTGESSEN